MKLAGLIPNSNSGNARSLLGATQFTFGAFIVAGTRNLLLAKLLGPELLAINSLSTQLLTLLGFLDLGAVLALKRSLPRTHGDAILRRDVLDVTRKATFSAYVAGCILMFVLTAVTYVNKNSHWTLAFLAACLILPLQGTVAFRSAVYVADSKQIRGSFLYFLSAVINFIATITAFPRLHENVIILGPVTGFVVAIICDNFMKDTPQVPVKRVVTVSFSTLSKSEYRSMFVICISQLVAVTLVNAEAYFSFLFMTARDAGCLGLIINLLVAISIFPIALSNQMSPLVNHKNRLNHQRRIHDALLASRDLLLLVMFPVVFLGTYVMQRLIEWKLPMFNQGLVALWVMSIATYVYTVSFFGSTYAMSKDKQREILIAQILAITFQAISVLVLFKFGRLSLETLAITTLLKFVVYQIAYARALGQMSLGELGGKFDYLVKISTAVMFLFVGAYLSIQHNEIGVSTFVVGTLVFVYRFGTRHFTRWRSLLTLMRQDFEM